MPRHLLRDDRVVEDDWVYLTEIEAQSAADAATLSTSEAASAAEAASVAALIIPFDRWLAERDTWSACPGRLGVVLLPAHKVEALAPDLARFDLIAAQFPGPSDGRGYTQARLLRERYKFKGEIRAMGYVRRDQLFFLARCGFNSFQLAENELESATGAFSTYSAEYQPANDEGLSHKLAHRTPNPR